MRLTSRWENAHQGERPVNSPCSEEVAGESIPLEGEATEL